MAEDLSKRGKVGDVYRSGSFAKAKKKGLKVSDLKKGQLKRAQTVGGKKITARQVKRATNVANKTNISDTKFVKGQGVLGASGKPLTGSVTLASGKTAQYVKGRRVVAGAKKAPASTSRGGSTGGSSGASSKTGLTAAQKAKLIKDKKIASGMGTKLSAAQANKLGAEGPKKNPPKSGSSSSSKGKNWYSQGGGGLFGKNSPFKGSSNSSGKPAKGDRRRNPSGVGIQSWNGKTWVTAY